MIPTPASPEPVERVSFRFKALGPVLALAMPCTDLFLALQGVCKGSPSATSTPFSGL